jgi:hypothetical protein
LLDLVFKYADPADPQVLEPILLIAQLERFDAALHDLGDLVIHFWDIDRTKEFICSPDSVAVVRCSK